MFTAIKSLWNKLFTKTVKEQPVFKITKGKDISPSFIVPTSTKYSIDNCTPVYMDSIGTLETLEMRIIRLRQQGLTQKQIAEQIGKTQNQTKALITKLIHEGKVPSKR